MIKTKVKHIISQLQEFYPTAGIGVGGATARAVYVKDDNYVGDMDIFTNIKITRGALLNLLGNCIFPGEKISIAPNNTEQPNYKMKGITKRMVFNISGDEYDFVFTDEEDVVNWYLQTQASTISQCILTRQFGGSDFIIKHTDPFVQAMAGKQPAYVINTPSRCTTSHMRKILTYCNSKGLEVNIDKD